MSSSTLPKFEYNENSVDPPMVHLLEHAISVWKLVGLNLESLYLQHKLCIGNDLDMDR